MMSRVTNDANIFTSCCDTTWRNPPNFNLSKTKFMHLCLNIFRRAWRKCNNCSYSYHFVFLVQFLLVRFQAPATGVDVYREGRTLNFADWCVITSGSYWSFVEVSFGCMWTACTFRGAILRVQTLRIKKRDFWQPSSSWPYGCQNILLAFVGVWFFVRLAEAQSENTVPFSMKMTTVCRLFL